MSDQYVQVATDGTGKKIDVSEISVAGNTVERQRIVMSDPNDPTGLAPVQSIQPADNAYGILVRQIGEDNALTQHLLEVLVTILMKVLNSGQSTGTPGLNVTLPVVSTVTVGNPTGTSLITGPATLGTISAFQAVAVCTQPYTVQAPNAQMNYENITV